MGVNLSSVLLFFKTIMALLILVSFAQADTHYVIPESNEPCPTQEQGVPCHTLSQYATMNDTSYSVASNITVILLPGNHSLDTDLHVQNKLSFSIVSSISQQLQSDVTVVIMCIQSARLKFDSINQLLISRIVFVGCVNNFISSTYKLTVQDCNFQGQERNGTGLELNNVLYAYVIRSSFSFNTGKDVTDSILPDHIRAGGALIIAFSRNVTILECSFYNNTVISKASESFGGAIFIYSTLCMKMHDSTFEFNSIIDDSGEDMHSYGGAVSVLSPYKAIRLNTINCTFNKNAVQGYSSFGGAVGILTSGSYYQTQPIHFYNSTFSGNIALGKVAFGGAIYVESYIQPFSETDINFYVCNTSFDGNCVNGQNHASGGALYIHVQDSGITQAIIEEVSALFTNEAEQTLVEYYQFDSYLTQIFNNIISNPNAFISFEFEIDESLNEFVNESLTLKPAPLQQKTIDLLIEESTFIYNTVEAINFSSGGAISAQLQMLTANYFLPVYMYMNISKSAFIDNRVSGIYAFGGAFYSFAVTLNLSSIKIENSVFEENSAYGQKNGFGGAICIYTFTLLHKNNIDPFSIHSELLNFSLSEVTVTNSNFSHNLATGKMSMGGAAYIFSQPDTSARFSGNQSIEDVDYGSADYIIVEAEDSIKYCNIRDCMFSNNTALGEKLGNGGALYLIQKPVALYGSSFKTNTVIGELSQGGAIFSKNHVLFIDNVLFISNAAVAKGMNSYGGALFAFFSNITVLNSLLTNNSVIGSIHDGRGGAIYGNFSSNILVKYSTFLYNSASGHGVGAGGAIAIVSSTLGTLYSDYNSNTVTGNSGIGGAFYADQSRINYMCDTMFTNNSVSGLTKSWGGSIFIAFTSVRSRNCNFINNFAMAVKEAHGGALYAVFSNYSSLYSLFHKNTATAKHGSARGGALFVAFTTISFDKFKILENIANFSVIFSQQSTLYLRNANISNNTGSLFSLASQVYFFGNAIMANNILRNNLSQIEEGGAVTAFMSEIHFIGKIQVIHNSARKGGGVLLMESILYTYESVVFAFNSASLSGGGIYAYQSIMNFIGNTSINENTANEKGGGIYAISSTISINSLEAFNTDSNEMVHMTALTAQVLSGLPVSENEELTAIIIRNQITEPVMNISNTITFRANSAKNGGGLYMETNSKLYVSKFREECSVTVDKQCNTANWLRLQFVDNFANNYGGALFIADHTNSGTCEAMPLSPYSASTECSFQDFAIYENPIQIDSRNLVNAFFTNNSAGIAGGVIYGGLFDRCKVTFFAEYFKENTDVTPASLKALTYLSEVTNLQPHHFNLIKFVSSDPVRICFCQNKYPNCSYQPPIKNLNTGQTFNVSLVALDQVDNILSNTSVHASVSIQGALDKGQAIQQTNIDGSCSELSYNVLTPQEFELLLFHADGPCAGKGISGAYISINIIPCPIGFTNTSLRCDCDPYLFPRYISNCSIDTKSVQRLGHAWIAYVNNSEHQAYIHHKYCPFDYCHSPIDTIFVNLNVPKGSDSQCAFNRSGKLCGSCKDNLSVMLGSSRCMKCSNNWLVLTIVFALAGVVLVAFLLVCNLTVAVGTLNGLILYANVIAANRAILFPFSKPTFLTVFIAWINLDIGIETCFYNGMDEYAKVLLQFVFPFYILFLVVFVISVANHSQTFTRLLLHKNPVATLATLMLLSYTKFIRIIIAGLSSTVLQYSDGYYENVWLNDGNISYLKGKHLALFLVAISILVIGIMYTFLLFFWHWIMMSRQKLSTKVSFEIPSCISTSQFYIGLGLFMDEYLAPYNTRHRYWGGLLLVIRIVLYLISSLNTFANPSINLLSIICTMVCLLILLSNVPGRVYKKWPIGTLESTYIFNITIFAAVSLYIREVGGNQESLAYTSLSIAFITFLAIVGHHTYEYILKGSKLFKLVSKKVHYILHKMRNRDKQSTIAAPGTDTDPSPTTAVSCTVVEEPIAYDTLSRSSGTSSVDLAYYSNTNVEIEMDEL